MIEIKPMDEDYIHVDCMHGGPVDPALSPTRGAIWQDAPDLPAHPWSDETIVALSQEYKSISEGWRGDPAREFMREMIQRYGTCAMLAWEGGKVVGQLRFYPLSISQLLAKAAPDKQPCVAAALEFEADPGALGVQCVMASRPYIGPEPDTSSGRNWPSMAEAGARKGLGLRLVLALIAWAREHGWKRIVKRAHADLDCMYGQYGGGGKAFWEKAGFRVTGTKYQEWPHDDDWKALVEAQAQQKGMTNREAWTSYYMAYDP
jgi:hypothetical protein